MMISKTIKKFYKLTLLTALSISSLAATGGGNTEVTFDLYVNNGSFFKTTHFTEAEAGDNNLDLTSKDTKAKKIAITGSSTDFLYSHLYKNKYLKCNALKFKLKIKGTNNNPVNGGPIADNQKSKFVKLDHVANTKNLCGVLYEPSSEKDKTKSVRFVLRNAKKTDKVKAKQLLDEYVYCYQHNTFQEITFYMLAKAKHFYNDRLLGAANIRIKAFTKDNPKGLQLTTADVLENEVTSYGAVTNKKIKYFEIEVDAVDSDKRFGDGYTTTRFHRYTLGFIWSNPRKLVRWPGKAIIWGSIIIVVLSLINKFIGDDDAEDEVQSEEGDEDSYDDAGDGEYDSDEE